MANASLELIRFLWYTEGLALGLVRLRRREKLDSGRDVVDMWPDMLGHMVLVTSRYDTASDRVFVLVVLGVEQIFSFLGSCIEGEPALIVRMANPC